MVGRGAAQLKAREGSLTTQFIDAAILIRRLWIRLWTEARLWAYIEGLRGWTRVGVVGFRRWGVVLLEPPRHQGTKRSQVGREFLLLNNPTTANPSAHAPAPAPVPHIPDAFFGLTVITISSVVVSP